MQALHAVSLRSSLVSEASVNKNICDADLTVNKNVSSALLNIHKYICVSGVGRCQKVGGHTDT